MENYYPFGLSFNSYSRENSVPQKYLYQQKEWITDLGLDQYDSEWRRYDPYSVRTTTLDPHADSYPSLSPYSWVANNPLSIIDPDGRDITENAFATTYTGADAQNMFRSLQASVSNSSQQSNFYSFNSRTQERREAAINGNEGESLAQQGGPDPDPWYVQAWNAYWNKFHETAVVFNMHDDPNAEGWNSAPMRGLVPDNITLEFNVGASSIVGGNATYTINLLTRGQDPGLYFTKTFQNSMGVEYGYGASLGLYHFSPSLSQLNSGTLLGRTDTYTGGLGAGGGISLGYLHTEKAYTFFSDKFFSRQQIELISLDLREKCDYENRSGKFVDYYYESTPGTDKVSFIYEYFLKCDSLRFILKYDLKPEPELIWFRLEGIEAENAMIINKANQLQPK